jgi:hypothetical protein
MKETPTLHCMDFGIRKGLSDVAVSLAQVKTPTLPCPTGGHAKGMNGSRLYDIVEGLHLWMTSLKGVILKALNARSLQSGEKRWPSRRI